MALKLAKYTAGLWRNVTDAAVKLALKELAEKLDALARDVDGGLVFVGAILIVLGDVAVPAGWEVVVELSGRVPLGTVVANKDAGTTGGSMSHVNSIPTQAAGQTGTTTVPHTHSIAASGTHTHTVGRTVGGVNAGDGTHGFVNFIDTVGQANADGDHTHGGNTGAATDTTHLHLTAAHNHGGNTGAADHTPAHVKVLFCRRVRPESR